MLTPAQMVSHQPRRLLQKVFAFKSPNRSLQTGNEPSLMQQDTYKEQSPLPLQKTVFLKLDCHDFPTMHKPILLMKGDISQENTKIFKEFFCSYLN